jgi:hypothetical protein
MTTPDGTDPIYPAASNPMPAPPPLSFPSDAWPPEAARDTPVYPPGYPGYVPPDQAYPGAPAMYLIDPNDPLVTPPGAGFSGWWSRFGALVKAHWKALAPIILIVNVVPLVVFGSAAGGFALTQGSGGLIAPKSITLGAGFLAGVIGLALVVLVVTSYLSAMGLAAMMWTITQRAAGWPAPLGAALRYGFRRGLRVFGWQLLGGLIIAAGTCALVLPGIYLAFALCLLVPVALFESENPISRSFSLTHRSFGAVLGRMALTFTMVIGLSIAANVIESILGGGIRDTSVATGIIGAVISLIIQVPSQVISVTGTLLTYAEMSARTAPTSTPILHAALGRA